MKHNVSSEIVQVSTCTLSLHFVIQMLKGLDVNRNTGSDSGVVLVGYLPIHVSDTLITIITAPGLRIRHADRTTN